MQLHWPRADRDGVWIHVDRHGRGLRERQSVTTVGCVGGLTLDWVRTTDGTIGPTVGGNALYSGVGAWLVGAQVAICAVIGADFPLNILERLRQTGFDLDSLRRVEGPSFRVLLDDSGSRRSVSYLEPCGHNDTLDPDPDQVRAGWDIAHIGAIPTSSQQRLAAALAALAIPYTLDTIVIPGEIEPAAEDLIHLASGSWCFLPSVDELNLLWPATDHIERLVRLFAQTARPIVETCGARGSFGFDGSRIVHVPAYSSRLILDTTGAGDAYSGAFAAASIHGAALHEAMALATAAASLVIEAHGAEHVLDEAHQQETRRRADHLLDLTTEEKTHVLER